MADAGGGYQQVSTITDTSTVTANDIYNAEAVIGIDSNGNQVYGGLFAEASATGNSQVGSLIGFASSSNNGTYSFDNGGSGLYSYGLIINRWEDNFNFSGTGSVTMHFDLAFSTVANDLFVTSPYPPSTTVTFQRESSLTVSFQFGFYTPNPLFLSTSQYPGETIPLTGNFSKGFDLTSNFDNPDPLPCPSEFICPPSLPGTVSSLNFFVSSYASALNSTVNYTIILTSVTFSTDTTLGASMINDSGTLAYYATPVPIPGAYALMISGLGFIAGIASRRKVKLIV